METLHETEPSSRSDRFTALAERVAEPLRRYAVRRTDPDTAQDVVAETMLVLWRRLDDIPEVEPLPWCYAVARGCLQNSARSARRQRRLIDRLAQQPARPEATGSTAVDEALHVALARLTESDQELIRLWAWEELQPREIATVLGISANAASIRLHRAKQKLVGLLDPGRKDPGPDGQERVEERRNR